MNRLTLRYFLNGLLPLLFSFYLVPGPLLHELLDHRDDCDTHIECQDVTGISKAHKHCELLQMESPVLFALIVYHPSFSKHSIFRPAVLEICSIEFSCLTISTLRGPPCLLPLC